MSLSFKRKLAFRIIFPVRYQVDKLKAPPAFAGQRCRVLLVSDQLNATSEAQFEPLLRDRVLLRTSGVVLDQRVLSDVLASVRHNAYEVVLVKMSFLTPAAVATEQVEELRALFPSASIVYMDGDDDSCIQWPAVLSAVDLYVKKHMFMDKTQNQQQFIGKNNLTDYVARHHGRSFAENGIPHSMSIPPQLLDKVAVGWNIADDNKIADLFAASSLDRDTPRTHDVMCRAACAQDSWIYPLRGPVSEGLKPLIEKNYQVLLPTHRVDQQTYYDEMRSSRICVSPFGYGEICWRDFEAVIMGCLLVKPDMSHITTEPNLFVPGETYVPCAWDFSDLADVCERYLADPKEGARIANNAYELLRRHYSQHAAVRRFVTLLVKARGETLLTRPGGPIHAV